jgi:hypothetical protein
VILLCACHVLRAKPGAFSKSSILLDGSLSIFILYLLHAIVLCVLVDVKQNFQ